jgi:hypothetical protein
VLRWAGALESLAAFAALPADRLSAFVASFGAMVDQALDEEPALAPIPLRPPSRGRGEGDWDSRATIFPFVLRREGEPVGPAGAEVAHRLMRLPLGAGFGSDDPAAARLSVELGQPVLYGRPDGAPAAALRLCLGARTLAQALADDDGERRVVDLGRAALAKAAWLARRLADLG